ncbi:hypothetical protein [Thiomicrorhabdus indica]|uniref:hypothetical protein n=1 Tax=Thiomicrorhabdus indica TaxID=2267253 RepID=UPI00102E08BA|nr:hypothetical protein [Thiomicrorhabdus indica]
MTIKAETQAILDQLGDNATWDDFIRELYKQKKITLGLTDIELVQDQLDDSDVSTILARLESSSSQPSDMRNTKSYNPGNAVTLGMISGVIAILFGFVFPPIAWAAAVVALVAGGYGISQKEEKAWIPLLLAGVSLLPILAII